MFKQEATANTDLDTALAAGNKVSILSLNSAANQTSGKAVAATSGDDRLGTVTYGTAVDLGAITASGTTQYYKMTVRLWLEGEDTTCTSATYAKLTSDYTLDLEFKLQSNDTGAVTEIGSALPNS